jgi:hypothetical protein
MLATILFRTFCLLISFSKNLKIKIYKTIILPILYGCEICSLTLREEQKLRVFQNRVLRRVSGPKREAGEECIMSSFIMCMLH